MDWEMVSLIGGGVMTVGGILVWLIKRGVRGVRRIFEAIDMLFGYPGSSTRAPEPGLYTRLAAQDEEQARQAGVLEVIRHEVQHNNGTSIKDSQVRTEQAVNELKVKLDEHIRVAVAYAAGQTNVIVQPKESEQ